MIKLDLDLLPLLQVTKGLENVQKLVREQGQLLVKQTRAHIVEEAGKRLHTRRSMFIEHLQPIQVDDDTWVLSLDAKYRWIDDGMDPHSMLRDLLGSSKAKQAKDGSRYIVVPFEHGPKGRTQMTPAQASLLQTIKADLKDRKIPYAKIEKDESGKAKTGLLHSFDINGPMKTIGPWGGWSQGHGQVGAPMVGPTGIPILKGVRVYQRQVKDSDRVQRFIMTFRVASSKHIGQGRWEHPGLEPVNLMEEGAEWAKREWDTNIGPQIIERIAEML